MSPITIRWPWQRWEKPPPLDAEALAESIEAVETAERRKVETARRLARRRVVIVNNHIAHDVSHALERRA